MTCRQCQEALMDLGSLQVARNSARCHDSYLRSNGTCTFSP